jgi:hypothetical protein
MTTMTAPAAARARHVLAAETIKLRSVRSTYAALAVAAVAAVVTGYLVTRSQASTLPDWAHMTARARSAFDPLSFSFTGLVLAQLAFGVLGILVISSEYTTGLIRTTFAAVPRRRTVVAAKAAVTAAVSLAAGEIIAFASFAAGQLPLMAKHLNVTLAGPGVLRGVLAAGLYLAIIALVGLGLGAIIRHTAGAVAAMFGLVFLIPQIVHALPAPWDTLIGKFMLDNAGQQMIALHGTPGYLPAGASLLVCLGYVAVTLAAGAFLVTRRDAAG